MVLHKNLTTDDLHTPKDHDHVEADITDLDAYLTETAADLLYSLLGHDHVVADITDFDPDDHIRADGTVPLTADWSAGAYDITLSGVIKLTDASAPSLQLDPGDSGSNRGTIFYNHTTFGRLGLRAESSGSDLYIDLQHAIDDGTSDGYVRMFRDTNTTGAARFQIMGADGTATPVFEFDAKNGSLQLPYLGAAPSSLTNGMIWMESDGLHLYYNGAEKTVAGV